MFLIDRRVDPYLQLYAILGCLCAVDFVLIIIVVLSLISVYIYNYIQVSSEYFNYLFEFDTWIFLYRLSK